jgi:hypothetical protein
MGETLIAGARQIGTLDILCRSREELTDRYLPENMPTPRLRPPVFSGLD